MFGSGIPPMPGGKERILLHLKISKARKKLWKKQDCGAAVDSFFPHSSALQDATDAVAFKSMTFRAPGRSETQRNAPGWPRECQWLFG